jgi:AraC-like DNA-binding protein
MQRLLAAIEIPQSMKNSKSERDTPGPAPAVLVSEISDPTAVGESIEVLQQDVVQLESKPLRVRRVVVRLGSALVLFHSTNLAVRTRTRLHVHFEAYTAFGPKAAGTVNGLPVSPDRVLASMPGVEVEIVVAAGYESVAFLFPPNEILGHLRVRHRESEIRPQPRVDLLTPRPAAAQRLYRWGRRLTNVASRQPELFEVPQAQAAARAEMVDILLATLHSVVQVELTPHDMTRQRHSQTVQLVEDYALSHINERINVTDLCEAAGVSERNLEYCFKEVMGMTPMSYLTRLRLHRVRQALRAATHASTTVTKEALRWGFWHFGDFSRAYKNCFGELPSDTLRRPPDAKESF